MTRTERARAPERHQERRKFLSGFLHFKLDFSQVLFVLHLHLNRSLRLSFTILIIHHHILSRFFILLGWGLGGIDGLALARSRAGSSLESSRRIERKSVHLATQTNETVFNGRGGTFYLGQFKNHGDLNWVLTRTHVGSQGLGVQLDIRRLELCEHAKEQLFLEILS